ncbi:hypothetical protein EDD37DRAFT_626437 [Exophiala viscosa]|uniref:Uncharacterized protein n=1 Tax=Exophiala viscosa TaxID=2486360 RepID=A0AAN6DY67_9EURO|nr:hypothetical protein EDD36DRAFT_253989 [Exophiala viscosa]KAI1626126.1 hypothetical protein EDD37DRAFT_626437 [Exophiala viscosa]
MAELCRGRARSITQGNSRDERARNTATGQSVSCDILLDLRHGLCSSERKTAIISVCFACCTLGFAACGTVSKSCGSATRTENGATICRCETGRIDSFGRAECNVHVALLCGKDKGRASSIRDLQCKNGYPCTDRVDWPICEELLLELRSCQTKTICYVGSICNRQDPSLANERVGKGFHLGIRTSTKHVGTSLTLHDVQGYQRCAELYLCIAHWCRRRTGGCS